MGIWRKLKGDNVKIIEDLDNKEVNRQEDPDLQNRLSKSHIASGREERSLILDNPVRKVPQPELTRDEAQLLVRKVRHPVLVDISRVGACGRGFTG